MISRIVVTAIIGLAFCQWATVARAGDIASFYATWSVSEPRADNLVVCHGFGCQVRTAISFSAADKNHLAALMARGRNSAAAERRAVAAAVAWFDRRVGPEAGTVGRMARAGYEVANNPRQMDCVDISHNNTSLFLVLGTLNLMTYHTVQPPAARGLLIDGRWPHATAVLRDRRDGTDWAIDSWTRAYGEIPEVKPLRVWLREGGLNP